MWSFSGGLFIGMSNKKYLISIVGPTAIGKTKLSITLAKHFHTEIISADSRQFFKEMEIGTAAPSESELSQATHHFIHHKSITDDYNVGSFEKEALELLDDLFLTKDIVIMVGGSGLYVNAVVNGLNDFPEVHPSIRQSLNSQLETNGLQPLQEQLKALDETSYRIIAIDNPHRLIRALEICIGTQKPYSSFLKADKVKRNFETISIGLSAERSMIYERINQRVDIMIEQGLVEEVMTLEEYQHLNALNTVGYKEVFQYLNGQWTFDFAISEIKKNTRRFAKRQMTWFKRDPNISWFDISDDTSDIIKTLENQIKQ